MLGEKSAAGKVARLHSMTSAKLSGGVGLGIEGIHVEIDFNSEWKLPWAGYYGSIIISRDSRMKQHYDEKPDRDCTGG